MAGNDKPKARTISWQNFDGTRRRRPAAAMTIAEHIVAGRIIKAVMASPVAPREACDALSFVQEDLYDWIWEEHDEDAMPTTEEGDSELNSLDIYHNNPDTDGPYAEAARSPEGLIDILQQLEHQLLAAYPNCRPLRRQISAINEAMSIIQPVDLSILGVQVDADPTEWIEQMQRDIYSDFAKVRENKAMVGSALLLAGLQLIADPYRIPTSKTERKVIQAHFPAATDTSIDAHRVSRPGILMLMELLATAARKYLDHQPETSPVLDSLPKGDDLSDLIPLVFRGIINSFDGGASLNASAYDVTATIITNTVRQALKRDVAAEQVIMLLLENIQHATNSAP